MGKYSDVNPTTGARKGGGKKNEDGREGGSKYNRQCDSAADGGPGMPSRKASKSAKETYDPNADVKALDGNRKGLETGAY
jgi:hypothetical protein